ncbi:hypothetical protein ACLK19_23505 [Escherichia coli]
MCAPIRPIFTYRNTFTHARLSPQLYAGDYADLLKHTVQSLIIESLKEKDKPFSLSTPTQGPGVIS